MPVGSRACVPQSEHSLLMPVLINSAVVFSHLLNEYKGALSCKGIAGINPVIFFPEMFGYFGDEH